MIGKSKIEKVADSKLELDRDFVQRAAMAALSLPHMMNFDKKFALVMVHDPEKSKVQFYYCPGADLVFDETGD